MLNGTPDCRCFQPVHCGGSVCLPAQLDKAQAHHESFRHTGFVAIFQYLTADLHLQRLPAPPATSSHYAPSRREWPRRSYWVRQIAIRHLRSGSITFHFLVFCDNAMSDCSLSRRRSGTTPAPWNKTSSNGTTAHVNGSPSPPGLDTYVPFHLPILQYRESFAHWR
jgi:hypothetical protein